jgi:hypothetical protein
MSDRASWEDRSVVATSRAGIVPRGAFAAPGSTGRKDTFELASNTGESLSVKRQRELVAETVELARVSTHRSLDTVGSVAGQFGDRAGKLTDLDAGFEPIEVTSPESR